MWLQGRLHRNGRSGDREKGQTEPRTKRQDDTQVLPAEPVNSVKYIAGNPTRRGCRNYENGHNKRILTQFSPSPTRTFKQRQSMATDLEAKKTKQKPNRNAKLQTICLIRVRDPLAPHSPPRAPFAEQDEPHSLCPFSGAGTHKNCCGFFGPPRLR